MAVYILVGTLAAFGALCVLWTLLGWLLPRKKGCALVFWQAPEPEGMIGYLWLRELGLLHCPILILDGSRELPGTEFCEREDLLLRLKQEWNRDYGTGNGDSPGRGQCRGVSEL